MASCLVRRTPVLARLLLRLPDFADAGKLRAPVVMAEARRRVIALWRDPRRAGWLMGAWFLVSLVVPPVLYVHAGTGGAPPGPSAGAFGWVLSAFLAWRVARGGRISRMLLILALARQATHPARNLTAGTWPVR